MNQFALFVAVESLVIALVAIGIMLIERRRVRRHRQFVMKRLKEIAERGD